jgi:hypothetical protein
MLKRVTSKIRSGRSPLIIGTTRNGGISAIWTELDLDFWPDFSKAVQRRGTDVSVPKIGSRDGVYVFGGI